MDEEKKHYWRLSMLLLIISSLLLLKFFLSMNAWDNSIESLLNIFSIIWPIMGFSVIFEFLRRERDKFGWGGMLFHFLILYSMFYGSFLVIQGVLKLSINPHTIQ